MKKPARQFTRFNDRQAVLNARRSLKMARSAHAYVRGNTRKFYEWLEAADIATVPQGPAVWICGDCHVGNLGPIANAAGHIDVQIRDLDQTVIGNPAHDLIRLGLSLATAARGSDLPGVTTAQMLEHMMSGYEEAFEDKADSPDIQRNRSESIRVAMQRSLKRSWKHLAIDRIENIQPSIPLGERFWPLNKDEKREIEKLFQQQDVHLLATCLHARKDKASVEVLDAAYWMKGCSSLGRLRYAVVLGIGRRARAADGLCLMDIKEATQAVAPRYAHVPIPRDNASGWSRVRHLEPNLGQRMLATRFLDRPVFLRELLPQDLQLEIEHLTRDEAVKTAWFLAAVIGQAHARQMDAPAKQSGMPNCSGIDPRNWSLPPGCGHRLFNC